MARRLPLKASYLCIVVGTLGLLTSPVDAFELKVEGWPETKELSEDPFRVEASDPIRGRLVCPSLTQLSLMTKRNDGLLAEVSVVSPSLWRFKMRPGVVWWGGAPVTTEDLESYLAKHLEKIATLTANAPPPAFSLQSKDGTVTVTWKKAPSFGPYLFSEFPFFKGADDSKGFVCAGAYRPGPTGLVKVGNLKGAPELLRWQGSDRKPDGALIFKHALDFPGNPWHREPDKMVSCQRAIDPPVFTAVIWNTKRLPLSGFRAALTKALPRGALLRSGSGGLGGLTSTLNMRAHPGYDRRIRVPEFDLEEARADLKRLGYKRREGDGVLVDKGGAPVELKIHGPKKPALVLEKVLVDSYGALGIHVDILRGEADRSLLDGEIAAVRVPWPSADLSKYLHSKSGHARPFFPYENKELDQALDRYRIALSQEQPSFVDLKVAHGIMAEQHLFTVVKQLRLCLEAEGKFNGLNRPIYMRNPNWFYDLLED